MNRQLLDLLMQQGADPNVQVTDTLYSHHTLYQAPATKGGTTALHDAAQRGSVELVRYLLEHGANPNLMDDEGRKPIDVIGGGAGGAAKGKGKAPAAGAKGKAQPGPGGRGGAGDAEIRQLLEAAMSK
jgi:hypothetical protein